MGQVGSAGDNAAMESFFALLQRNVLDRRRWATRHELRIAIITWIERTYHRRRRQAALGRLTPIEYEMINTPPATPGRLTRIVHRPGWMAGASAAVGGRSRVRARSMAVTSSLVQGQVLSRRSRRPVGVVRAATCKSR
jgi:putative transposase